jgi:hypothetical protein
MNPEPVTISRRLPPAVLAATVRSLAHRVDRLRTDPAADPRIAGVLLRRIARLQSQLPGQSSGELSMWTENLRRQVEVLA